MISTSWENSFAYIVQPNGIFLICSPKVFKVKEMSASESKTKYRTKKVAPDGGFGYLLICGVAMPAVNSLFPENFRAIYHKCHFIGLQFGQFCFIWTSLQ